MYLLGDLTAFYSSAEKVFDPKLRNKGVIIAGSNDGVVIAVCPIAKRLGLKKFEPVFMQRDLIKRTGVVVKSANFELYGELSRRMHSMLRDYGRCMAYSIDEAFISLDFALDPSDIAEIARSIRRRMWDELRLPICIGAGKTLTLAKAANHASKRLPGFRGVAVIDNESARRHILQQMTCEDVWGIGSKISKRLGLVFNIKNALALAGTDTASMRKCFDINVANTIDELNGTPRLFWDDIRASKKQIFSTRTVGTPVQTLDMLSRILTSHALNVCRKAREQKSLIVQLVIFARASPFKEAPENLPTSLSELITFASPTSCYKKVASAVRVHSEKLFKQGIDFVKVGAGALSLTDDKFTISDLFEIDKDDVESSILIDNINKRFGKGAITLGSVINTDASTHLVNRGELSPPYLTSWLHLPKVYCK